MGVGRGKWLWVPMGPIHYHLHCLEGMPGETERSIEGQPARSEYLFLLTLALWKDRGPGAKERAVFLGHTFLFLVLVGGRGTSWTGAGKGAGVKTDH